MALHAAACTSQADNDRLYAVKPVYNPDVSADECSIAHSKQQIL